MAEPTDALGQRGDRQRQGQTLRAESRKEFLHGRPIALDQRPLLAPLGGPAEGIESRAAQEAKLGEQLESMAHPTAVAALDQMPFGVAAGEERRREVEGEAHGPIETRAQPIEEASFCVEPRHLVLVLIGHQLEQIPRDRLAQRLAARYPLLLDAPHFFDQLTVAAGIRFVLIVAQEAVAALDLLLQGSRDALVLVGRWRRLGRLAESSLPHRFRLDGGEPAPGEGLFVHADRRAVELDRALDGLEESGTRPSCQA